MIYTLTLNPSLDYIVDVDNFKIGAVNRTACELIYPGGKGINVSIVLNNLGIDNMAYGFVAGFVGDEIVRRLDCMGLKTDFIKLSNGNSRINMTLRNVEETSINGMGAVCSDNEYGMLMDKLVKAGKEDILVLSGSVPKGIKDTVYEEIFEKTSLHEVKVVADVTGKYMKNILRYKPFLIKPNVYELEELFDVKIRTNDDVVCYARKLHNMGAKNVLISIGKDGAVLCTENEEIYIHKGIEGKAVNTIGAGDSMVAGFLAGYIEKNNFEDAFYMGIAAGTASAFSDNLATGEQIEVLYRRIIDFS